MTTHQDTGTEHPFVLVGSKGLAYVGLHKDEASCWMVALGWPDADEIAHRKAQGFAVYQATLTWQKQAAIASRDEAAQQPQGQAVSDEQIVAMAVRMCWQYRRSTDPHHSDTYKFNTAMLLRFVRSILALRPDHFPDAKKMMPVSDDFATIAGLESAVGHLSTLVDEQRALLVESEDVFGRDGHGGRYEDGECGLIDRIRAHLEMTAPPPNGITAKEQGNEN